MNDKIDYVTPLTLEQVIQMEKAVNDLTALIRHQNLILMNMLKHNPPALAQLLSNVLILNCNMNDHLGAVSQWLGDSLFNMLKENTDNSGHC